MANKQMKRSIVPYIFLSLFMIGIIFMFDNLNHKVNQLTYDEFTTLVETKKVKKIY